MLIYKYRIPCYLDDTGNRPSLKFLSAEEGLPGTKWAGFVFIDQGFRGGIS